MSALPAIGTIFEHPGFKAKVVGVLTGISVFEVELDGLVPAHAAEADEMAIVLQGVVRVTINDEVFTRHVGEWLIVPAGTSHAVEALEPARLLMIG